MAGQIVGVHGIAQEQLGRHQIEPSWSSALQDGVERALHSPLSTDLTVRVAYYGDLFLRQYGSQKSSEDDMEIELSNDEEIFLNQALDDIAKTKFCPPEDQKMRIPGSGILRRADKLFGNRATALLYIGALRQVRRYLLDPAVKAEAERRIDEHFNNEVRILIGHSLGSVVAFEYLRLHPDAKVELLLTVGSPLGLRMVRKLMEDPSFARDGLPRNVTKWVNVYDPADPVACACPLSQSWPSVDDASVHNGSKPHSAVRYLSKEETGHSIVDALGLRKT